MVGVTPILAKASITLSCGTAKSVEMPHCCHLPRSIPIGFSVVGTRTFAPSSAQRFKNSTPASPTFL